ncbi:aldehyde dehydrogenase A [Escherichia coli]|uniref:Aldehyde dehydrogenase A n=33 Tax=root TaxID=1 RepID=A0A376P5H3_ECOLX|nr:aldehyde dehydrogenase A [Escherichia coli]STI26295.1 aldehyde dehydrogenase A [Escherichia coli]
MSVPVQHPMYIDGQFVTWRGDAWIDVVNPATEAVISRIPDGQAEDARKAIDAAERAQPEWEALPAIERASWLRKISAGIRERASEISALIVEEGGKIQQLAEVEVAFTADYIDYMAEWARRYEGEIIQSDRPGENILLFKRALGVTTGILPWNFPFFLIARKMAPALLTGNTIVIKPSEFTPNNAIAFAKIVDEIGLPRGVFNLVLGRGETVGQELAGNPKVAMVSMTGSVSAGEKIMATAAKNITKVCLELGGKAPEESPENKTGIVRCDLIDCANNFKEITTMPARSLCQNFLNNILAPLHLYRQKSLIDATNAVINGASLTLTSIGRHLTGTASVKNKIKRVDRLLGNRHLQNEVSTIFQRITQKITRGMSRVVILIDWSAYHASRFQLLRASLACDGRSLPLMSCVVPSSQTANADVHERFLESLAECFSPGTDVIVITDAGFQGRWFQQLRSRGWTYICRVLGNHYYNVGNGWEKVSDSGTKASTTAIYLGEGLLGRDKNAQHEGHFYLYKSKPKGRRFKRSKERATRPSVTAKARTAGKSPWFIFTNSTEFSPKQVMKLYSRRMQIEQNFRDEKNPRWGFGLRFGASHSSGRVTVLSLIATLASIIMWLSGFSLENKGIHHKYQANTVKHRRVISLLKLAENVIRHSPLILNTLSLDAGLKVLQQRYTNMIMVY